MADASPLDREIATNAKLRSENEVLRERLTIYQRGQALRKKNEELRASLALYKEDAPLADSVAKPLSAKDLKKIEEAFKSVDKDGSGSIDATELRAAAEAMCEPMSEEDVKNALLAMDKDGDGTVSFDEFKNWWLTEDHTSAKGMRLRMLRLKMKTAKTARLVRQRSAKITKTISTGALGEKGLNFSFGVGDVGAAPCGMELCFLPTDEAAMADFKGQIGVGEEATIVVSLAFALLECDGAKLASLKEQIEGAIGQYGHMATGGVPGLERILCTTDAETLRINLIFNKDSEEGEILAAVVDSPFSALMVPNAKLFLQFGKPLAEYLQGDANLLQSFSMLMGVRGDLDESLTDMMALMGDDVPMALVKTCFQIFGGFSVAFRMNSLGSVSEEAIDTLTQWQDEEQLLQILSVLQKPGDDLGKQARKLMLKGLGFLAKNSKLQRFCKIYNLSKDCLGGVHSLNVWMPNGHLQGDFKGCTFPAWLPRAPDDDDVEEDAGGDGSSDDEEDIWS